MSEKLSFSYKTNSGSVGNLTLPYESTIYQIKLQISKVLSVPVDAISIALPNRKSLNDDQTIKSLNLSTAPCFIISTEISEIPIKDYFSQLHKKINAKDAPSFIEIIEEWEESFDLYSILNSENAEKWTLLHFACYKGADLIVEYLVSKGAMCNSESEDSWTPLELACYNGHTECVKKLLKHPRIQINRSTNRGTALHQACRKGQSDILYCLLDSGAEMTIEDSNGLIPLQVASNQEVFEIIPMYMGQKLISGLKPSSNVIEELRMKVIIENRDLLIVTNLNEGTASFQQYKSTDSINFSNEFKVIKLIDIYDIRESSPTLCIIQGKFGILEIRLSSCRDFIYLLERHINYCHINKLGYTVSPDSQIPLVINQSPSRNVSFHRVSITSFNILAKLYSTAYANYYAVSSKDSSRMFLLKQVPKGKIQEINKTLYYVRESKLLQHIRHNFIVRLYYAFQTRDNLYFVFENCKHNLLFEIQGKPLQASAAKVYVAQILLALECIHSRDIVYRNLSPANIWIDPLGNIKLMNFELAKENVNSNNKARSFVGCLGFIAPEFLNKDGYEKAADIYALGPCLYQMLTGHPLFNENDIKTLILNIKLGNFSFPANFPGEIKDFLSKVMQKDPNLRPDINALKKQAWLRDVNWNDLAKKRVAQQRRSLIMMPADLDESQETENIYIEEDNEFMYDDIEEFDYFGNLS